MDSRKWIPRCQQNPPSESDSGEARLAEGVASLEDMFPMDHEVAPEHASLVGRFSTAQLEDPNLASALQQVTMVDGKSDHLRPFFFKEEIAVSGSEEE